MIPQLLLLIAGVFCCSTSVIFIKLSAVPPILLASYRLLVASAFLTPLFFRSIGRMRDTFSLRDLRHSILPGVVLAVHFIVWNVGARLTLAANSTLIVNMVPVVMPCLLFFIAKERVTRREIVGTSCAMLGVLLLGGTDVRVSRSTFMGDTACFISMILFALYLSMAKKNNRFETIWLYIVPLYYIAGFFCLIAGLLFETPPLHYDLLEAAYIAGLGIVPTVAGHSILNYSMRRLRGQLVSIAILSQFVFAGVMGFLLLGEIPNHFFYSASVLLVGGGIITVLPPAGKKREKFPNP
ncbi:MAG: DMT family transporter [Spirochaetes bacterium]|nr:DMT family transporter [Spirochaetota bacterium]